MKYLKQGTYKEKRKFFFCPIIFESLNVQIASSGEDIMVSHHSGWNMWEKKRSYHKTRCQSEVRTHFYDTFSPRTNSEPPTLPFSFLRLALPVTQPAPPWPHILKVPPPIASMTSWYQGPGCQHMNPLFTNHIHCSRDQGGCRYSRCRPHDCFHFPFLQFLMCFCLFEESDLENKCEMKL